MSLISSTTSPIFCDAPSRPCTSRIGLLGLGHRLGGDLADWPTWRLISAIEVDSSSVAEATVCTLAEASSEAAATAPPACRLLAVADMLLAVDCSCVDDDDTESITFPTEAWNWSAIAAIASFFSTSARAFSSSCSAFSRLPSIMLSLKIRTARRHLADLILVVLGGISVFSASRRKVRMASVMPLSGRVIERARDQVRKAEGMKMATLPTNTCRKPRASCVCSSA